MITGIFRGRPMASVVRPSTFVNDVCAECALSGCRPGAVTAAHSPALPAGPSAASGRS
jgi:hypothetical protein